MISALLGLAGALGPRRRRLHGPLQRARARRAADLWRGAPRRRGGSDDVAACQRCSALVWSPFGCAMAVAHGVIVAVMCILLYMGMRAGPSPSLCQSWRRIRLSCSP